MMIWFIKYMAMKQKSPLMLVGCMRSILNLAIMMDLYV